MGKGKEEKNLGEGRESEKEQKIVSSERRETMQQRTRDFSEKENSSL